jgi:ribosomal protein S12 methylthiotransferase accessory factor
MEISKIKLEGAQRACAPIDTIKRMRPFWRAAGITRVGEITGLDRIGIPVAQCIRPDAKILSVDSGKGVTSEAAVCSAMMEGFERHVGESAKFETIKAPGSHLKSVEARFQLLKGSFYNPHAEREWTSAIGILSKETKLVPAAIACMSATQSESPIFNVCFSSDSNGLSSGNTLEEAVAGGLYEVIERDQVTCSGAKGIPRKRVNLDSIDNEILGGLVERLRSNEVMPILFDCTLDIGVPTFIAYIYDMERGNGLFKGYAAHLDPVVAQCRAICEAVQGRAVYMSGSRDDVTHKFFTHTKNENESSFVVKLLSEKQTVSSNFREDKSGATFLQDINLVLKLLDQAGIPEPLIKVYKHSYPCSVLKVMIPTLEGYSRKYAKLGERALK